MKQTINYKEIQRLHNAVSKKLAQSIYLRKICKIDVHEEQAIETELNYACIVLDVSLLFDETSKERAETLHMRYLDYKNDIAADTNFLSNDEYKDCHRVRGRLEAIQWFYGEIVKILEIEDNDEAAQTTP